MNPHSVGRFQRVEPRNLTTGYCCMHVYQFYFNFIFNTGCSLRDVHENCLAETETRHETRRPTPSGHITVRCFSRLSRSDIFFCNAAVNDFVTCFYANLLKLFYRAMLGLHQCSLHEIVLYPCVNEVSIATKANKSFVKFLVYLAKGHFWNFSKPRMFDDGCSFILTVLLLLT